MNGSRPMVRNGVACYQSAESCISIRRLRCRSRCHRLNTNTARNMPIPAMPMTSVIIPLAVGLDLHHATAASEKANTTVTTASLMLNMLSFVWHQDDSRTGVQPATAIWMSRTSQPGIQLFFCSAFELAGLSASSGSSLHGSECGVRVNRLLDSRAQLQHFVKAQKPPVLYGAPSMIEQLTIVIRPGLSESAVPKP